MVALNRTLRKVGINAGPRLVPQGARHAWAQRCATWSPADRASIPRSRATSTTSGIDVLQAYGLTETTAAVFANSPHDNEIGSVGKAMKGVEGKDHRPATAGRGAAGRRGRAAGRGRDEGILEPSRCHRRRPSRWMVPDRRPRLLRLARPPVSDRAQERSDRAEQRQECLSRRNRGALPEVAVHQGNRGAWDWKASPAKAAIACMP